eukprot:gene3607-4116_t
MADDLDLFLPASRMSTMKTYSDAHSPKSVSFSNTDIRSMEYMEGEASFGDLRPSLAHQVRVGYFSMDRACQTEHSDIIKLKETTKLLKSLVQDVALLKKNLYYAKLALQADYNAKIENRSIELYNRTNSQIKEIEKMHEERVKVVRHSFRAQFADAIKRISTDYHRFYLNKGEKQDSRHQEEIDRLAKLKEEEEQEKLAQQEMIEMMQLQMTNEDEEEEMIDSYSRSPSVTSEMERHAEEIRNLTDKIATLEERVDEYEEVLDSKNEENINLAKEVEEHKNELVEERNANLKLSREIMELKLAMEIEKKNNREELEKQKHEMQRRMEEKIEEIRHEASAAAMKQISKIEDANKFKESQLKEQMRLRESQLSEKNKKLQQNFSDSDYARLKEVERQQRSELTRLQKDLEKSNKTWELKVTILQQTMHALKDEMFIRTSLQRQSAKLQHAAITYAVSLNSHKTSIEFRKHDVASNNPPSVSAEISPSKPPSSSRRYQLPSLIQGPRSNSGNGNNGFYQGCYEIPTENLTNVATNTTTHQVIRYPEICAHECAKRSFSYAAVFGNITCSCLLQDLAAFGKVDESECGKGINHSFAKIYSTLCPVIYNATITGRTQLSVNESSEYRAFAWLSSLPYQFDTTGGPNSSTRAAQNGSNPTHYISAVWSVNRAVYKRVNKTVNGHQVEDAFMFRFSDHGMHTACCDVSNAWSKITKCISVWVLESIQTLQVVDVRGGQHKSDGLYAIVESDNLHLDVVVNAGSYADLHFDFGDDSGIYEMRNQHTKTRRNCSCLSLLTKTHAYKNKGSFSLNITARNSIGRRELIYKDIFAVDGVITGGALQTNVAIAGARSQVNIASYGEFRYAAYEWDIAGSIRKTLESFIYINFPNNAAQYPIKVAIFNNVSKVNVEGVVYIQPRINSVSLSARPLTATVGQSVRFQATASINYVSWNSRETYIVEPGDGSSLHGTKSSAIHQYSRFGHFKARVTTKNLANSAVSDYIDIHVYEAIHNLDAWYSAFHFGQSTVFFASIETGSNVTFYWDFGDETHISTNNRTVQHRYLRSGNYTFTVIATNRVSQEQTSRNIFVVGFDCTAPRVSLTTGSYEQDIAFSSNIRVEVDVAVNCSASRKAIYRWKVFQVSNGQRVEKSHKNIGVKVSTFRQRTLIIPSFSLAYGKYEFVLRVEIKRTIVYSEVKKIINIVSTGLVASIKGGSERKIGRRNHENITLDATDSHDPDSNDFSSIRFHWACRSIGLAEYGSCFKPNATTGFNWTNPVIEFLPRILISTANTFAFTVTVSKNGLSEASAVQFLVVENGSIYDLNVECRDCHKSDVNSHKMISLSAESRHSDPNVHFKWEVFFVTVNKVFFRYFGQCIGADGSAWHEGHNANHTNTTSTTITNITSSIIPRTTHVTTTILPVTEGGGESTGVASDSRRIICAEELAKWRKNFTDLLFPTSNNTARRSGRKRRSLFIDDALDDETGKEGSNEISVGDKQLFQPDLHENKDDLGGIVEEFLIDENTEINMRLRRSIQEDAPPPLDLQVTNASALSSNETETGFVTGITGEGGSDSTSTSTGSASSGPRGFAAFSGFGAGTGSGIVSPGVIGSGSGCDYGTGLGRGFQTGSGSFGTGSGCSGNEDKFGEGAKNKNQTDVSGGGSDEKTQKMDKYLKEKLTTFRQVMHPAKIKKQQTQSGFTSKNFKIKKDTLVPGQLYMVQLTAFWKTGSEKRLAGQTKNFFTTNTGPFLGSCVVYPKFGYELHTGFSLRCTHWKDKHYPLKQIVQFRRTATDQLSYIYNGHKSKLSFVLPAGEPTNNYTIALVVTIEDGEGVRTNLCPIEVQVLPIDNQTSLERRLYNATFSNDSLLKQHEDVADINSAMTLASALPSVTYASSMFQPRVAIREGILTSLKTFDIQDPELTQQVIGLIKDATKISRERSQTNGISDSLSSLKLETDILSTKTSYHTGSVEKVISLAGCSFTLPTILRRVTQNLAERSSGIRSRMSVYEESPFSWTSGGQRIDSKVASLVFENSTGHDIRVANLVEPITIKLPLKSVQTANESHVVKVFQMNAHGFNVTRANGFSSAIFIRLHEIGAAENSENYRLQAVLRFDEAPTKVTFNRSFEFQNKIASISFSPLPEASKVYVGVYVEPIGRETSDKTNLPFFRYNMTIYTGACLYWDSSREIWSGTGCKTANDSQAGELICRCNHLTSFGGHIEHIFSSVKITSILNILNNEDSFIVLVLVSWTIGLGVLSLLYICIVWRKEGLVARNKGIFNLPDNHTADSFKYLVITETGCCKYAGTSARVSLVIYGQEGYSQIRELTCSGERLFQRGSTDCIMMSFPDSLGEIRKIRLWHDNGGRSPSWFMKQITIVDCQNETSWYFHFNDWLAIGEHSRVDCELPAKKRPMISLIQVIFEGFLDYHFWLSVFTRPSRSNFSNIERCVGCFSNLLIVMFVMAYYLQKPFIQHNQVHGFWDVNLSPIYLALFATAILVPLRLLFGFILRNSGKANGDYKNEDLEQERKDASVVEGSGALYFLNTLSAKHSSEIYNTSKGQEKSDNNPKSNAGEYNNFSKQQEYLYVQALILYLLFSIIGIEMILALVLSIQRFYLLCKDSYVKKYLKIAHAIVKLQGQQYSGEVSEEKIMEARDRARFVRFSKPISGDKLRKSQRNTMHRKHVSSLFKEIALQIIYLVTLITILSDVRITENHHRQLFLRNSITRSSDSGGVSFDNITSTGEFWNWTESTLLDVLRWDCWEHLKPVFQYSNKGSWVGAGMQSHCTFGPARLSREQGYKGTSLPISSLSNETEVASKILLVGNRDSMLSTLHQLKRNEWINNATKHVHIDISYYHPEREAFNTFSYVQLGVKVPPYGKFMTEVDINIVQLHYVLDVWMVWTSFCKVLFLLCILISLRKEFCLVMDRGLSYMFTFWSLLESSLIIACLFGVALHIYGSVVNNKLLYQAHRMYLNDSKLFLDLSSLVLCQKLLTFAYASALFAVVLRTIKLLCFWDRFALISATVQIGASKLTSYFVAAVIIIACLTHTGRILLGSTTWQFSEIQTAIMTLFSLLRRKTYLSCEGLDNSWLCRLYKVIALIAVFALWRISVIFFFGTFYSAKSAYRKRPKIMKILSKRLRKYKKKQCMQLVKSVALKFWKKPEEKYRVNELPLESVFEEIECQVEEVVFRMNNLFNMQLNCSDSNQDGDCDTVYSSEDAAYPSSYSTKDSISYASESMNSDDSGFYRYAMNRDTWHSIYESEEEFEGPVIHHLDEPKQRLSETGQILSPIFGGRYFIKSSWSTFRAPKIQPGSITCKPTPIVRPKKSRSNQTFEKLNQWSTATTLRGDVNATDLVSDPSSYGNEGFEDNESTDCSEPSDNGYRCVGPTRIKLPRALDSIYKDAPRQQFNVVDPFKRPPKLPAINNVLTRNRKLRSFTKITQVSPMGVDTAPFQLSSRRSSGDSELTSRSPSLDSGIIRVSETDEGLPCSDDKRMRGIKKPSMTDMFEIRMTNRPRQNARLWQGASAIDDN